MKISTIVVVMAAVVAAYKDGRLSPLEDFPPYQGIRQHSTFHEQRQPFQEQPYKTPQYQSYRQRPYRQDSSSYREQISFRDYSLPKSRPFYGDRQSFRDASDLKNQASFFTDGPSFPNHRYKYPTSFKDEIQDQSVGEQYSYQQESFPNDFRISDLYKDQEPPGQQTFGRDSEYLKHGNHGLGYVSVPPISPYENALPLNEEASTTMTPTTATTTTQKPSELSILSSTARTISQVHTSATSVPKVASHTGTMPTVKFDTLADDTATTTSATSMIPTASVTTKQSSNLANPPTVASLPVVATESPIISFGRHTVSPIEFQSGKFTAPGSYYITSGAKNKAQQSLLTYLLAQQGKTTLKSNEQNPLLNYVVLPPVMTNSLNNKIQNPVSSYVHPEEGKSALKDSLLNYMLQQEPNHGLSVQQSSLPETVNYVPLTNTYAERPKLSLSSLPFSTLSAVPRPMETINYVSATVPRVSGFATQDTSPSAAFPLGSSLDVLNSATSLPSSLGTGFTQSQSPSIFSSLPAGLNGGISAGIPGSLSATVPGSLSTLSLGQNFQHLGHLRQFEPARSQPLSYSPGLQLQLGGYGGIDYTLRPSNPAPRPLELGIAKVGLSLPEFPRQQLPAFSKMSLEHPVW